MGLTLENPALDPLTCCTTPQQPNINVANNQFVFLMINNPPNFLTGDTLVTEEEASSPTASPAKPAKPATPAKDTTIPTRASKRLAKTAVVKPVTPPAKAPKRKTKAETEKKVASPAKKAKKGGKKEEEEIEEEDETTAEEIKIPEVPTPEPIATAASPAKAACSKVTFFFENNLGVHFYFLFVFFDTLNVSYLSIRTDSKLVCMDSSM